MSIKNSVVLITGANRGIGKSYVEEFIKQGAKKIYLGVRNPKKVADLVKKDPDRLVALKLDVTSAEDIKAAASKAKDVTILINNAGVLRPAALNEKSALKNARAEMEVNYFAPLQMALAFYPVLKKNKGILVNVSSIAGRMVFPGLSTYSASKHAVHALTVAQRMEFAGDGIRVIGVYPGPIDTDMAADIDMEKEPPSHVAQQTIKAINENSEDVFPDAYARETYQHICEDSKAVEKEMAESYIETAKAA